ncbi:unnamed protein product [Phytophthora lilii]|uniref:Unnamed protein product n=1 Tax=Phytophthora lilii TaxID=2077276 RepID=A0A9W6X4M2_9STRA|nr:unnamed protein product [Phytophthora lilii]
MDRALCGFRENWTRLLSIGVADPREVPSCVPYINGEAVRTEYWSRQVLKCGFPMELKENWLTTLLASVVAKENLNTTSNGLSSLGSPGNHWKTYSTCLISCATFTSVKLRSRKTTF